MALNPLASLLKTCLYVLAGRVQLGHDQVGAEFVNERGQRGRRRALRAFLRRAIHDAPLGPRLSPVSVYPAESAPPPPR